MNRSREWDPLYETNKDIEGARVKQCILNPSDNKKIII
jgi:hypothetical protein